MWRCLDLQCLHSFRGLFSESSLSHSCMHTCGHTHTTYRHTHTHNTHLKHRFQPPSLPVLALLVLRRLSLLLMPVFLPWFLSVFFGLLITSLPPSPRLSGPTVHRKASTRAPTPLRPGRRTREKCASRTPTTCASSLTARDGTFSMGDVPSRAVQSGPSSHCTTFSKLLHALHFPDCRTQLPNKALRLIRLHKGRACGVQLDRASRCCWTGPVCSWMGYAVRWGRRASAVRRGLRVLVPLLVPPQSSDHLVHHHETRSICTCFLSDPTSAPARLHCEWSNC